MSGRAWFIYGLWIAGAAAGFLIGKGYGAVGLVLGVAAGLTLGWLILADER